MQNISRALALLCLFYSLALAEPRIFYTDIVAGPNTGGENNNGCYLTLNGTGFGEPVAGLPPASTKVYIGGEEVAAYKYLGHMRGRPDVQQLAVQIGPTASTGAITVEVGAQSATAPENFTVSSGAIRFVSTAGNDTTGDGSIASPYRSVKKALSLTAAGDHVVIRGGSYLLVTDAVANGVQSNSWIDLNYPGNMASGTTSGTETAPITVMGYPGEDPVGDWETGVGIVNGIEADEGWTTREWYTFSNITFDLQANGTIAMVFGAYGTPTMAFAHLRLANLTVTGGMGAGCGQGYNGISLQRTPDMMVYGIDIGNQDPNTPESCASHRMYVSHDYNNADIAYNYFHDNPYGGRAALQIAGDTWGSKPISDPSNWGTNRNVRVHHNYFKNLPAQGVLCNLGSFEVSIYDNVFENMALLGYGAISLRGAQDPAGEYHVYNNTFIGGGTSYLLEIAYQVAGHYTYPASVELKNNIFYGTSTAPPIYVSDQYREWSMASLTEANDIWYGADGAGTYPTSQGPSIASWMAVNSSTSDPLFVNREGSNLRLQAGSPARDTADATVASIFTSDYAGVTRSAWDIGAFAYATSASGGALTQSAGAGALAQSAGAGSVTQ